MSLRFIALRKQLKKLQMQKSLQCVIFLPNFKAHLIQIEMEKHGIFKAFGCNLLCKRSATFWIFLLTVFQPKQNRFYKLAGKA